MRIILTKNLIKIHSAITETLSFSCLVLFVVMADGIIEGQISKKSKWPHARIIPQSWYDSTEIFSVSLSAIFRNGSNFD